MDVHKKRPVAVLGGNTTGEPRLGVCGGSPGYCLPSTAHADISTVGATNKGCPSFPLGDRVERPTQDIELSHHSQLLVHSLLLLNGTFSQIRSPFYALVHRIQRIVQIVYLSVCEGLKK
jgi:hypothetical protein